MSDNFEHAVRDALATAFRFGCNEIVDHEAIALVLADKHAPRVAAELRAALLADEAAANAPHFWPPLNGPATAKEPA